MTNGSGVTAFNNAVKEGVTEKVTFGKDLQFMREQAGLPDVKVGTSSRPWMGRAKKCHGPAPGEPCESL